MSKRRITVHDVRQALLDDRFRATLPEDLADDVSKFLKNPTCACNQPIYLKVMRLASKQVADYFPAKEAPDPQEAERQEERLTRNEWQVINCSVHDLVHELRKLGPGRKQVEVARYQDQVTVVVNHLEHSF